MMIAGKADRGGLAISHSLLAASD